MAYSSGMLNKRVSILVRDKGKEGDFGKNSGGRDYTYGASVWAAVDFVRGVKTLREGAYDAYDRIMVRMRWNSTIDRQSRLIWQGKTFQIESFNEEKQQNIIQVTAVELPGKDMTGLLPSAQTPKEETPTEETPTENTDNNPNINN